MRFRYFDSEGTEVGLSSVDALRFRIQTGVVTPETLLYDAAAGQWTPARQNPLFRFLVEEDEDLLPQEYRDLMDGGESRGSSAESETGASIRWSAPRTDFEADRLDASLEEGIESLEDTPTENGAPFQEDGTPIPDQGALLPEHEVPVPDDGPSVSGDDLTFPDLESTIARDEPAVSADDAVRPEPDSTDSDAESPLSEKELDFPDPGPAVPNPASEVPENPRAAESTSPPEPSLRHSSFPTGSRNVDETRHRVGRDPESRYPEPSSPESAYRDSYSRRRRARPSLAGVAALSILLVFLVGIPILVIGGGRADEDGTAYALVGGLTDDLVPDEGSGDDGGDIDEVPGGSEGRGTSRGAASTTAALPATGPERLDAEEVERLAAEADAAASEELEDALANLRIALRVPRTPPAEWLQGPYLAEAPSFSGVERYWIAFASLVTSMRELEGELYRGFLQSRIPGTGLHSADQARISALALERHDRRSEERAALYRDLELLASNAIALHDTLVARSDDITERAFDGTTLTRYPFMAAVPDDPVLAEHIWSRVDVILDVIHALDGARPTSVTELRAAVRRETPGGAGDPLDELPDWWPRPTDRRSTPAPAPFASTLPEPEDLPVPTQEVVVPD